MIEFKFVSSLEKILPGKNSNIKEKTRGSMLKNEIYSFQLAACAKMCETPKIYCKAEIDSPISDCIKIYRVGYVPVILPCYENSDEDYITKEPCLLPDPLFEVENGNIEFVNNGTRAYWITVEPKGKYTGVFPIGFKIFDDKGNLISELCYNLTIIDKELPKQQIYNTCWFHGDCIAVHHKVEMMSEKYWELIEKYLKVYVKFGHNMILTPVFTPPLDTAAGAERMTNQLVDIEIKEGKYYFCFENLRKWILICKKAGIEYFEISHLFTQWGAKNTPKIMAKENGKYKRIFGWETRALSDEYRSFLLAFLPELISFLKAEEVYDSCFFHVSDEPPLSAFEQYAAARELLVLYIDEDKIIDALSDYEFYSLGAVKKPIVPNDCIKPFLENKVPDMWTYHCCIQGVNVSNRFMAMPSYRNRILGYQIYKNDIKGFLQWGFNFWFSQESKKVINPYAETAADSAFPSGDAFVVYPDYENDDVVCSLRLYVFNEAMQDLRALFLLESLKGRAEVLKLLDAIDGFDSYPRSIEYIETLREKINFEIEKHSL